MTAPSLSAFFASVGPYLEGKADLAALEAALGSASEPSHGLPFYAWLVKFDQQRILGEMYPRCRQWLDRLGVPWDEVTNAFVADHPPEGWSVPHLGERFADWLLARTEVDPRLPVGIEAVADLAWTRFLARNAPDVAGLGMDQRVHVRPYRIDALAVEGALARGEPVEPHLAPATVVVYRHASGTGVHTLGSSVATIAVLLSESAPGSPLPGVLGQVPAGVLATERERLRRAGVLQRGSPDLRALADGTDEAYAVLRDLALDQGSNHLAEVLGAKRPR